MARISRLVAVWAWKSSLHIQAQSWHWKAQLHPWAWQLLLKPRQPQGITRILCQSPLKMPPTSDEWLLREWIRAKMMREVAYFYVLVIYFIFNGMIWLFYNDDHRLLIYTHRSRNSGTIAKLQECDTFCLVLILAIDIPKWHYSHVIYFYSVMFHLSIPKSITSTQYAISHMMCLANATR